jgi:serine/threonine protein kinase
MQNVNHTEKTVGLIIETVLGALTYAHDSGHLHGDLRPANI